MGKANGISKIFLPAGTDVELTDKGVAPRRVKPGSLVA